MKKQPIPLEQLDQWYQAAIQAKAPQPEAVTLATATKRGRPSARIVLYKGLVKNELFFVSNYNSRKGKEIAANPYVAVVFSWLDLERQIRIEGKIKKATRAQSDAYWNSRPRDSQLSALASNQSHPIESFADFEKKVLALEAKYKDQPIPRPAHWGGYCVTPQVIEFWQGRSHRRHERVLYVLKNGRWKTTLLSP